MKKIKNAVRLLLAKYNYSKQLNKIKKYPTNKKIRVLFYVCENSKWCYQSLYDILEKSDFFEPLVCVSLLTNVHKGTDKTRNNLEENYQFFKSRGMRVEYGYKNHEYINLKTFEPDIVFYEQRWSLPKIHQPYWVSKYALTCYCTYGFDMIKNQLSYVQMFQGILWKLFAESELNVKYYDSFYKNASKNCVVTGWPKLDFYYENHNNSCSKWKEPEKFKIIYAPHHSIEPGSYLKFGTFLENGKFILEWAKSHPEITWVFKPHPRFKLAILSSGYMNEEEVEKYYQEWENIGICYSQGAYLDIFQSSDLMITDCASFLAEYLPTGKPLVRLVNKDAVPLNSLGEMVVSGYYKSYNNEDLLQILDKLVVEKDDYMKEERLAAKEKVFNTKNSAAESIYKYLLQCFNRTN